MQDRIALCQYNRFRRRFNKVTFHLALTKNEQKPKMETSNKLIGAPTTDGPAGKIHTCKNQPLAFT